MSGIVFINYRRRDAEHVAGRLFDRLERDFAEGQLFFDVDNIPPGEDFVAYLNRQVAACDVLLALVGPNWQSQLDAKHYDEGSQTRDFVRIEIEAALQKGKRVIPVLVGSTEMPREEDLPESLRPFSRRNAVRLTHERFRADAAGIINALKAAFTEAEAARTAAEDKAERARKAAEAEAARQRAEAERKAKAEREASERAKKEAATRDAIAGLSPAQVSELKAWNAVKDATDPQVLRAFIKEWSGSPYAREAERRRKALTWSLRFPLAVAAGLILVMLISLFVGIVIDDENPWPAVAIGLGLFFAATLGTAATLSYRRRETLTGPKLSSYWLGCSLALVPASTGIFAVSKWDWVSAGTLVPQQDGVVATGLTFALIVMFASALMFSFRPREALGRAERNTYWIACALVTFITVPYLFAVKEWNWIGHATAEAGAAGTGLLLSILITIVLGPALVGWRALAARRVRAAVRTPSPSPQARSTATGHAFEDTDDDGVLTLTQPLRLGAPRWQSVPLRRSSWRSCFVRLNTPPLIFPTPPRSKRRRALTTGSELRPSLTSGCKATAGSARIDFTWMGKCATSATPH